MTFLKNCDILYKSLKENGKVHQRGVAQFGRALRSGRRGRRFESCHLDHIFQSTLFFISVLFSFISPFLKQKGNENLLVEKDVSERILSLYDAEDLKLCEAYAVDAHLGENLPEFATVYRAEPEHFCFVINPDRIGRNYFKLYNHRFLEEATKMARICFFDASYCKAGNPIWKKLIETFCWEADEERIPLDTPIPSYTKLEG